MINPKVIYIAGPMSGLHDFNRHSFYAAEAGLRSQFEDAAVINPVHNFGKNQSLDWSVYMRHSIHQLLMSDMIYMLDGWKDSAGARLEHMIARALKLEIGYQKVAEKS